MYFWEDEYGTGAFTRAVRGCRLSDKELSVLLGVSVYIIRKWKTGLIWPSPLIRKEVITRLQEIDLAEDIKPKRVKTQRLPLSDSSSSPSRPDKED